MPTARRAPAPQTLPATLGARALDGNASITARLCNLAVRWGERERAHEEWRVGTKTQPLMLSHTAGKQLRVAGADARRELSNGVEGV